MPGAPPPNVLELARSSCAEVASLHKDHIQIVQEAVEKLAGELPVEEVQAAVRGMLFPIKFDTVQQEINLMALYHLLDFGSGYDSILLQRNRRDQHETLQFGVIGMHLSGTRLDFHWMKNFSSYSVHNLFGIEAMEEQEVMPGVTMSKPGVLHPLTKALVQAVNETGSILEEHGHKDLGDFVSHTVAAHSMAGQPPLASALVQEITEVFPAFRDMCLYDGHTLTLQRKAQALVADLGARFGKDDPRFAFTDLDQLTADSGPSVIAALRAEGILQLSNDIASTIDSGDELPSGPHERALRAAAVVACDAVVAAGARAISAYQLGAYLSMQTEEGQKLHGKVKKHMTRGVTAY